MQDTSLHFYHSKLKLNLSIFFFFPFVIGGYYIVYMGVLERSFLTIIIALFFSILFSFFWGAAILKLIRNQPYITITNTYIQIDPQTKSEITIYFDQIHSFKVTEVSFQKVIEVVLENEGKFFEQFSLHNKIRLGPNRMTGFNTITIGCNAIPKRERPKLLAALDNIIILKNNQTAEEVTVTNIHDNTAVSRKAFFNKYDSTPSNKLAIDKAYFKEAYLYSFFIFLFMFVFLYIIMDIGIGYVYYIIVSFVTFPLAKVLFDWMGVYKLRQKLEKQKGVTYYFYQLKYLLDAGLYHVSIFIAPVSLLFLLIRFIVKKAKHKS